MDEQALRRIVADSLALKQRFFDAQASFLLALGSRLAERLSAGARLLAFGNGGSAADAQHFVAELVVRLEQPRRALPAIALTTDSSILTAAANDFGYESVFRRQLEAHGRPGDVALAISTSGCSRNVVEAARAARALGLHTVGLTGNGGGALAGLVHDLVDVPHRDTQRIQEVHGMVLHLLAELIDEAVRG